MAASTTSVKPDQEGKERRVAFHASAQAAWGDFQATGLHVTANEADAWLAELESGADAQPPECHA